MKDTGERLIPEYHQGDVVWSEHYVRYFFSEQFVKDKVVLDIACGSGYGSQLIANAGAAKVFGVDVSPESIDYAKKHFPGDKIEYSIADAEKITLPDNSVDIVVTFETIEHVKDYKKFLKEIKRVMKKDGLMILSTPNEKVFPKGNHFHLKEFLKNELVALMEENFKNSEFLYQDNWVINLIAEEDDLKKEGLRAESTIRTLKLGEKTGEECMYFMVIASDETLPKDIKKISGVYPFAIEDLRESEKKLKEKNDKLEFEFVQLKEHNKKLENELKKNINMLNDIFESKSWKLVSSIRSLKTSLRRRKGSS